MKKNKVSLSEIVEKTRLTGNTSWILRSAIDNYKCAIVYGETKEQAELMRRMYFSEIDKTYKQKTINQKLKNRSYPLFMNVNEDFSDIKVPVIFDNSCILNNKNI
jgi:hypothetical protein